MTRLGQILFAVALVGLGVEHFVFQDFVTGRAPPWPASTSGQLAWAYLTGFGVAGAGVAILIGRQSRAAAFVVGALIVTWAFARHIPVIAADSLLAPSWTSAGKALTFFGGAWAIGATLPPVTGPGNSRLARFVNGEEAFIRLGRACLGAFLILTGIQHYMFTPFVASLVPAWIPGTATFWTYFTGAALIAGGTGLQLPRTARLAALLSGLMVFSWFWIVHLPRTFLNVSSAIAVFEALAVSGIAFALAGYVGDDPAPLRPLPAKRGAERIGAAPGGSG